MNNMNKEEIEKLSHEFTDKLIQVCNEFIHLPADQIAHDLLVGGIALTLKNTGSIDKTVEFIGTVTMNCINMHRHRKNIFD